MITIKLILNLHIRAIRSGPGGPTENYWPNSVGPVQQFSWDRIVSVGPVLDHFFGLGPNLGPRLGPNSRAARPDARPARPEPSLDRAELAWFIISTCTDGKLTFADWGHTFEFGRLTEWDVSYKDEWICVVAMIKVMMGGYKKRKDCVMVTLIPHK